MIAFFVDLALIVAVMVTFFSALIFVIVQWDVMLLYRFRDGNADVVIGYFLCSSPLPLLQDCAAVILFTAEAATKMALETVQILGAFATIHLYGFFVRVNMPSNFFSGNSGTTHSDMFI